jgi:hypothetical protein
VVLIVNTAPSMKGSHKVRRPTRALQDARVVNWTEPQAGNAFDRTQRNFFSVDVDDCNACIERRKSSKSHRAGWVSNKSIKRLARKCLFRTLERPFIFQLLVMQFNVLTAYWIAYKIVG